MNKKTYIYSGLLLIVILVILSFLIIKNKKVEDNIRFANEYGIIKENIFVYKNVDEIIRIMEHGTGIIYLGFPECPWCRAYVKYLNEVGIDVGVDEIYYYNILEDRKNNTDNYKKIVSILGDNLQYDKDGNHKIFVPNVSFHIGGKVVGNDFETSLDTNGLSNPLDYWTDDRVFALKTRLTENMEKVTKETNSCTSCNK